MQYLQLACPYCAGQFSAAAGPESRTTACPHCERDVTVPAAPPASLDAPSPPPPPENRPQPPTPIPESKPPAEINPPRRLTPSERARLRRRVNFALAVLGMAILAAALLLLVRFRP